MTSTLLTPAGLLASRRTLLRGAGQATLSAMAVGLLAGCQSMAADKGMASDPSSDVKILNTAIA